MQFVTRTFVPFLLLTAISCTYIVPYDPEIEVGRVEVPELLDGKALIWTTTEEDGYVYTGKPISFSGLTNTPNLHLGDITRETALVVFGGIFREGAEHSNTWTNTDDYTIVVTPRTTGFSYNYNTLRYLGFAIRPEIEVTVQAIVSDSNGGVILEKTYSSGAVTGDTSTDIYFLPVEELNIAVHETIIDLLSRAALDTYNALVNNET